MKNKIHIALDSFFIEKDNFQTQIDYFKKNNIEYEIYRLVPFSHEITPQLPADKLIVPFGCIEFVQAIRKMDNIQSTIFFNDDIFTNENCLKQWKSFCLNSKAKIMTFKEAKETLEDKEYFIRPIEDTKSFTGNLFTPGHLKSLQERYSGYENNNFTEESKIIVSEPRKIKREWRNFIIDGKVISSSLYKEDGVHKEEVGIPNEVLAFCRAALYVYNPARAFALDVCELEDGSFAIVEFGCIHNCGFYKADMNKVTEAIMGVVGEV